MDDRPIDLRPLDPDEDPWREQRVVGAAMARVRALQREADAGGWLRWLEWWRPAVAFATAVIAVSAGVLATSPQGGDAPEAGVAAAVAGVPPAFAEWMRSDRLPAASEVLAAMEGYR